MIVAMPHTLLLTNTQWTHEKLVLIFIVFSPRLVINLHYMVSN